MKTPLTRANVTAGSRIMLPLYPLFLAYVGLCYRYGDPRRTVGPSFDFARDVWPMRTWGLLFIAVACLIAAGYLIGYLGGHRVVAVGGLLLGASLCLWWAVAFYRSAAQPPPDGPILPSLTGWAVWVFLGCAFTASAFSLTLDKVDGHAG